MWCARKARILGLMLALLPLLSPSRLAAQLTFRRAEEMATLHRSGFSRFSDDQDNAYEACLGASSPFLPQMAANSALSDSWVFPATVQGTPRPHEPLLGREIKNGSMKPVELQGRPTVLPTEERRRHVALCTAVVYAELYKVNSQILVLRRQEMAAARLLDLEALRVVTRFDNPDVLTRAKLLAARTRLWAAELDVSRRRLHKQLADLTGLPEEEVEPVTGSMPSLPDSSAAVSGMQSTLNQLVAARDVAQLEYVLAHINRMHIVGRNVLGTATLGDEVAACIIEDEKFNLLLEANFELHREELHVLQLSGKLEEWISADAPSRSELFAATSSRQAALTTPVQWVSRSEISNSRPVLQSIMITPAASALVTGRSQQFSAIAIYGNGSAKDATADVTWRCSNDSDAIISTSGLVTALATGQVTIGATLAGVSQSRRITITADNQSLEP